MENIARVMMNLIASEICGKELNGLQGAMTNEELLALYRLSKFHDLAHLVGNALIKNNLIENGTIKVKFQEQVMLAIYRSEKMKYELNCLKQALNGERIPFIPLKGSVLRQYYPEPWMRTSCDIDVLVRERDFQKAQDILIEKYGYTYHGKGSHNASLFSPAKIHIELHYNLIESVDANAPAGVLEQIWDVAVLHEGFACWYEMPDEYFYFYHIAHMAKHFENGGCGIRPFIDLWLLNHVQKSNEKERNRLLCEGNLLQFANSACKLSNIWFANEAYEPVFQKMESYILRGGAYGISENRINVQQQQKGGCVQYAVSKIFIPYSVIKFHYPILLKHRWLTPFMEVRRWGKLIFCGHLKRVKKELQYNQSISRAEASSTKAFLKDIGL